MTKITVLLADDHTLVRQGLVALLEAEPDLQVVAQAETGRVAVHLAKLFQPEVVVMDVAMPELNGLEATRRILKALPATRVLVLSSYSDDEYARQVIEAGAAGYLLKAAAVTELVKAIREARMGRTFFGPAISKRLITHYRQALARGAALKPTEQMLTSREVEALQLIAEGKANKQIAADLGLSIKTVEKHRQQLMNKLGIHDIAGLTRYAIAKGVIRPGVTAAVR
jgi:DNA-binding NarL/FixJ family response regulator